MPSIRSRKAALPCPRRAGEAAGDAVAVAGLLARLDPLVRFAHRGDLGAVREAVRVRLDARLPQPLELRPPLGEQIG